jgi:hypothetical protein
VTARICSRCHSTLHREEEGSLVFCWNCGAPQVQLSEELRDQIDQQISAQQAAANPQASSPQQPSSQPAAPGNAIVWRGAINIAGLAGAVAAALTLLAFALPPLGLLSFFWFISAPIVVLGVYHARFRHTSITTRFGARLGLLTGLATLIATTTLYTIGLVLERFVFHSTAEIDALFQQMHTTITEQSGPPAKAALDLLAIPEFRAGILLASIGFGLSFYLAYCATAGAFAGYFRSRTPRA